MSAPSFRRSRRLTARLLMLSVAAAAAVTASWSSAATADNRAAQASFTIGSTVSPFITVAVAGGSTAVGAGIVVHDVLAEGQPTDGRNRWIKIGQPNGAFLLQNVKSRLCVQSGFFDPTVLRQFPCAFNEPPVTIIYQRWKKVGVDPVRPAQGRITNGGGLTWDLAGATWGSNVIQSTVQPGKPSQTFRLP